MSFIERDNHLVVHGWMITDLHLKGVPLIVYACIYGFTQTYDQAFTGSMQYLAEWADSSSVGVWKAVNSLEQDGLIEKILSQADKRKYILKTTQITEETLTKLNEKWLTKLMEKEGKYINKVKVNTLTKLMKNINKVKVSQNPPYNPPNKVLKQRENIGESNSAQTRAFDTVISKYSEGDCETERLLHDWIKNRRAKRAAMTAQAIELNLKKMRDLAEQSNMELNLYLEEIVRLGWTSFFVIKNYNVQQNQSNGLTEKSISDMNTKIKNITSDEI